jgi:hypothetical protein
MQWKPLTQAHLLVTRGLNAAKTFIRTAIEQNVGAAVELPPQQ